MFLIHHTQEDPIYYSSCLVREVDRVWMPVRSDGGDKAARHDWFFKNGGHCLDCDSYAQNYLTAVETDYDVEKLPTPHWWLQPPCGACEVCEASGNNLLSGLSNADVLEVMGRDQCSTTTHKTSACLSLCFCACICRCLSGVLCQHMCICP